MRQEQNPGNLLMAGAKLKIPIYSPNGSHEVKNSFRTPIALFNFNRPHLTRQVFDVIRQIKPRRLLLVADGPRPGRQEDARLCAEVRAIFDEIDWECEVSRNFSDSNMGSFKRNSSGLNWVFDTVEEAIILEDDCIPSLSFFPYCEELLNRFRDDPRVGVICGSNFGFSKAEQRKDSYFFTACAPTWGWASWRRVWQRVDLNMSWWEPDAGKKMLRALFPRTVEWQFYYDLYESIRNGEKKNAWDYQLLLASFRDSQYRAIPRVNLISNVGFSADAANCTDEFSPLQAYPKDELGFPLNHPERVQRSILVDHAIFHTFIRPTILQRAKNKVARMLKRSRKIMAALAH